MRQHSLPRRTLVMGASLFLLMLAIPPCALAADDEETRKNAQKGKAGEDKGKDKDKDKDKKKPAAALTTDGVFTGIDQGDYAHWKMRTADGKEVSYFILRPDASVEKVIANPKKFAGKKCRVTWKKSVENIPEGGGKMEIEQILSVEWTKSK